jgi:CubicO group peptidase (beta-lactamase class C family)
LSGLLLLGGLMSARADEVDRYVEEQMRQLHIPGVSLAVVQRGQIVKLKGYGFANLELRAPVSTETVFEIGSISKQFTAAAVMMLVEEGKIGLEDKISKYLTGVPQAWEAVTVRHLLTHSSGIKEYLLEPGLFEATARPGQTHEDLARLFFNRLPLEFQPGQTWAYSNTGYLLLGNIIEKASGKSYWAFLDERICKPLGMEATRSSQPAAMIPGRAAGYEWAGNSFQNRPPLTENAYAAGSIVSTPRDLAKWDAALNGEKLLKRSSLNQMWTPATAAGGAVAPFDYNSGWFIDIYHGHHVVYHSGGTPGFSSVIYRFLEDGLTVIILTNHGDRVIDHLAVEIAGMYAAALARPEKPGAGPDVKTSEMLKTALLGLSARKPDATLFTPAMQLFLNTAVGKEVWPWTFGDGELKSFTFSESERKGGMRVLRYKAVLGAATRWFSFAITADQKIAQINWW